MARKQVVILGGGTGGTWRRPGGCRGRLAAGLARRCSPSCSRGNSIAGKPGPGSVRSRMPPKRSGGTMASEAKRKGDQR